NASSLRQGYARDPIVGDLHGENPCQSPSDGGNCWPHSAALRRRGRSRREGIRGHAGHRVALWRFSRGMGGPHGRIPPWLERNGLCRGQKRRHIAGPTVSLIGCLAMAADLIGPEQTGLLFYARMLYFAQRRSRLTLVLRAEE